MSNIDNLFMLFMCEVHFENCVGIRNTSRVNT